ncbi:MAG: myo-inosose-2 dehydratase [Gammaproteobacteria bacterium]|nr:MAG: myo-inosose-2 dehydratase [Gammaproteobacteria bacterium]
MRMKLGIAPINWCNDDDPSLGKDISFEQSIREMAEAGFVGTEIGSKYPCDPVLLKAALSQHNLEVPAAWFSTYFTEPERYEETLLRFLEQLSFLRAMGAHYINVCECGHSIQQTSHPVVGEKKPIFTEAQWEALIRGLHRIGRIAHDFDVKIVYHYHAGTGVFTEQEIDFLMQHTSDTLVSLLVDTGHAVVAGIDPVHLITRYANRVKYVHLKDIRKPILATMLAKKWSFMDSVRAGVFTVPGDGDIDFATVIAALNKIRYQGWLLVEAEQDPAKAPPLHYAKKAHQYMSSLLGGLHVA